MIKSHYTISDAFLWRVLQFKLKCSNFKGWYYELSVIVVMEGSKDYNVKHMVFDRIYESEGVLLWLVNSWLLSIRAAPDWCAVLCLDSISGKPQTQDVGPYNAMVTQNAKQSQFLTFANCPPEWTKWPQNKCKSYSYCIAYTFTTMLP